jgi:hypothetical protein
MQKKSPAVGRAKFPSKRDRAIDYPAGTIIRKAAPPLHCFKPAGTAYPRVTGAEGGGLPGLYREFQHYDGRYLIASACGPADAGSASKILVWKSGLRR